MRFLNLIGLLIVPIFCSSIVFAKKMEVTKIIPPRNTASGTVNLICERELAAVTGGDNPGMGPYDAPSVGRSSAVNRDRIAGRTEGSSDDNRSPAASTLWNTTNYTIYTYGTYWHYGRPGNSQNLRPTALPGPLLAS